MNIRAIFELGKKGSLEPVVEELKKTSKAAKETKKDLTELPTTFKDLASAAGDWVKNLIAANPVVAGAAAGLTLLGGAALAAGAAIAAFTVKAVSDLLAFADAIVEAEAATSANVETLQKWKVAIESTGGSFETLTAGVIKLQQNIAQGDDTFERLGLSLESLRKLKPEEQFEAVGRAILEIKDPLQQQQAALEAFGASGKEVLKSLRSGFLETAAAAKDVIPEQTIRNAKAASDMLQAIGQMAQFVMRSFASLLVETGALSAAFNAFVVVLSTGVFVVQQLGVAFIDASTDTLKLVLAADELLGIMGKVFEKIRNPFKDVDIAGNMEASFGRLATQFRTIDKVATIEKAKVLKTFNDLGAGISSIASRALGGKSGPAAGGASFIPKQAAADLEKFTSDVKTLGLELNKALGGAQAASMGGGLATALRNVAVQAADLHGKIDKLASDALRKGLDPGPAEKLRETVFALTNQLEDNAVQAERQKVLGETFDDIRAKAFNLLNVIHEFENRGGGLASLTDEALRNQQAGLENMVRLMEGSGQDAAELRKRLEEANALLRERGVLSQQEEVIRDRNLDAQRRYWDEEDKRIEESKFQWGQLIDFVGEFEGILGALGVAGDSLFGGLAQGAGQLLGIFKPFADAGASLGQTFKGIGSALMGKQGIGGFLSGAAIAGQVAGAAVGIVKSIAAALGKPAHVKVMEQVGKNWGVSISEEMGKTILETSESLGIAKELAALLHITDVAGDVGAEVRSFGKEINSLFEAVAAGAVPSAQGIEQLGEAFTAVRDEAARAGTVGDQTLRMMIRRARELGVEVPEIAEHLKEMAAQMAAGAKGISSGLSKIDPKVLATSQQFGTTAAQFFVIGFQQQISEQGLLAALDDQGGQLIEFYDTLVASGNEAGAALLAPFVQLQQVLGGETGESARGFLETLQGIDQVFVGMANSDVMSADAFAGFQSAITTTAQALKESGLTDDQVFAAIGPQLQHAQEAAANFGLTLDANVQTLIDQAQANGLAFSSTPAERSALAMEKVASILERVFGAATNTAGAFGDMAVAAAGAAGAAAGIGLPGGGGGGADIFAAEGLHGTMPNMGGGLGPTIQTHAGERVDITPAGSAPSRSSGGDTYVTVQVDARGWDEDRLLRTLDKFARRNTGQYTVNQKTSAAAR